MPVDKPQFNGYVTFSMFNNNGTKSVKEISTKFKNVPNINMRGTTFDVRHLDKFIQSGAGNPQIYSGV